MIPQRQHPIETAASDAGHGTRNDRDAWIRLFPADGRPWQRSLRWQPEPVDRRVLAAGLLVAFIATLLEFVGFGIAMQRHTPEVERRTAVQVELIEPAAPPPAIPPEPVPPVFEARVHKVLVAPPETRIRPPPKPADSEQETMRARIGAAGAPAVRLFNADGSIELPKNDAVPATPKNPQEAGKARWAEMVKRGDNPLDCHRTRFARNWTPDESIGGKIGRKYLKWVGLYDPHDTEMRAQRAAEGCDPAR